MNKRLSTLAFLLCTAMVQTFACTNFLVGKNASTDGSTIISYSADSYAMYGYLCHFPAATYPKGTMLNVRDWDSNQYLGQIEQARKTYNVIGNINEFQLTIAETTFTGRPELRDSTGIVDYGSLIYIALQRSRTAREAIHMMANLVQEYGYASTGESFSIADPNEVWIMEMIGKGPGVKGAVWVAVRIPDDCIAAHANQARIRKFNLNDKENCMYSPDVISFAREKGYFNGVNKDFSFADAYAPIDFHARRFCEARVWSFYRMFNPEMDKYLSYIQGTTDEPMPLYIKAPKKISVQDIKNAMRDHYEGTALDPTTDMSAGAYKTPNRFGGLTYKVGDQEYFNERPISTQQTSFTFVSQMRADKADAIGGVLWFGLDEANMTVYTPIYCCTDKVPSCYAEGKGDLLSFSWDSSFWIFNWVSNMVYPRYSLMIGDLRAKQSSLETSFNQAQDAVEAAAAKMLETDPAKAKAFLTNYSNMTAQSTFVAWKQLGEYLMVKYNDGTVKREKGGKFERNAVGMPAPFGRPGYPKEFQQEVVKSTGDRYKVTK